MNCNSVLKDKIKTCYSCNCGSTVLHRELIAQGMSKSFCDEYLSILKSKCCDYDSLINIFQKWVDIGKKDYSIRTEFPECYI